MRLLVVNTGSSSLKLQILDPDPGPVGDDARPASDGPPERSRHEPGRTAAGWSTGPSRHVADWDGEDVSPIAELLEEAGAVAAVGHRVVHGGVEHREPTLLDDEVIKHLDALTPLAPLHQQRALAGIAAARQVVPDIPHVACFDTAHHATIPEPAATYALPADWRRQWPLRRFGFHGLSHAYAAGRAAELVGRTASGGDDLRAVTCHLGAGASLCASRAGRSVDTTMGFTPLEGLVMGTRAGSVDPGLVLWLITEAGVAPKEVSDALEHRSGLQGLAGTPDMAEVLRRADAGGATAQLARDVYVHVLAREVAAMTASLGGLDVLVFTGGVGEHAPTIRAATAARLGHLGIVVDPVANAAATTDTDITADDAPATTLVVTAREDVEIAHQVHSFLSHDSDPA